jgi:hypothetical protein
MFLIGRCSCQLKNKNPGWDVLLNIDWKKALKTANSPAQAQAALLTHEKTNHVAAPEVVSISSPSPTKDPSNFSKQALVGGVQALGAMLAVLDFRPKKND